MKESILLILGLVLVNNYVLSSALGLVPALGFASQRGKVLSLGLTVTCVTVLVSAGLWLLRGTIPVYFRILAAAALALAVLALLQLVLGKKLGVFLPLIALNSVVLAAALKGLEAETLGAAVLGALGAGLGFLFALFLFAGLSKRIEPEHLPKAFRGFPIQLLAAAIVALALTAFQF